MRPHEARSMCLQGCHLHAEDFFLYQFQHVLDSNMMQPAQDLAQLYFHKQNPIQEKDDSPTQHLLQTTFSSIAPRTVSSCNQDNIMLDVHRFCCVYSILDMVVLYLTFHL